MILLESQAFKLVPEWSSSNTMISLFPTWNTALTHYGSSYYLYPVIYFRIKNQNLLWRITPYVSKLAIATSVALSLTTFLISTFLPILPHLHAVADYVLCLKSFLTAPFILALPSLSPVLFHSFHSSFLDRHQRSSTTNLLLCTIVNFVCQVGHIFGHALFYMFLYFMWVDS